MRLRAGLSALRAQAKAMWIATAIASDDNPIKTGLGLVKPVAQTQRDSEKGVASPTGVEPGRDQ
jgi:hypothetical protein